MTLEEERKALEEQRRTLEREKKEFTRRVEIEDRRLEQQQKLFDMKFKILEEELVKLVKEELLERTNYECVFFTAGGYSDYGVPMFQECCHYFSSYD